MRRIISLSLTLLLSASLNAAVIGAADAKHGKWKHWHQHRHGKALASGPAYPRFHIERSARPPDAAPADAPVVAMSHSEWCAQEYETYDPASDTFLRYDAIRVPCISPQ